MIRSALVHTAFILSSTLLAMACITSADARYMAELDAIVKEHATEQQAAERLRLKFEVYERGTPSWDSLQAFLRREPADSFAKLREAVGKYPRILYHTTEWRMTWLFVDEQGRVRDYLLSSQ